MAAASKPPFSTNPAYRAFAEQLQYGRQYPAVAAWTDVEGALQREFSLMWDRVLKRNAPLPKREVQGLLTTAATDIDGIISQSR
jgi:multiple sugar transport system substrate-binding protein